MLPDVKQETRVHRFLPGYGSLIRAVIAYFTLIVLFAIVYNALLPVVTGEEALIFSQSGRGPTTFLHALYFSVVTQTTVGIGDIIPQGNLAKALVALQSLTGYGFIILFVSLIVHRRMQIRFRLNGPYSN